MYDIEKDGPLKMFLVNGTNGNSEIAVVFKKYNMKLPWQNGGNGGKRPMGEPSVESVDNEDVVTLSSDASSGASLLELVVKKRKVEKSIPEELMDRRTRLDKQTQDTVVSKRKCKDKSKDKENGRVQHERGPYKGLRTSTP